MKPGKKARQWNEARRKLKKLFEEKGIVTCQLRYEGCWISNGLSFAHSKRRRFIQTDEELAECILCCTNCHSQLDREKHEVTEEIVKLIRAESGL